MISDPSIDPKLDLVFERHTNVTVEKLWKAWTDPNILMQWFCPRPWKVSSCRIELKPGGEFYTLMEGPQGESIPNNGCFLEIIENKKLVWTGMMTKGFRPAPINPSGFQFVAYILFTKTTDGSHYKAIVSHTDEEGRLKHENMGFQEGWGAAFEQLLKIM